MTKKNITEMSKNIIIIIIIIVILNCHEYPVCVSCRSIYNYIQQKNESE